ncbi:hypothetical protein MYCTH_2306762 [Thermothelomyces thermophilus ATCC 42464]|uniref:Uncharacterized protein n=1 Tax=Thermothelomyces thermophilus (strain ATCC 42464 / BCRC 31852 / DSM 1799) TaxID=573729 RepID=G2QET0_THET4|nr:uncharacterized protein MYCTH_2306762 [Thermothelomyces thermophilus ATCC 42464]AEO58959.1 hypothetical protein MYCTH_2306762 [Thermothelomyces thermophilus ATCC 42464]
MASSFRMPAPRLLLTARSATLSSATASRLRHAQGWTKPLPPTSVSPLSSSTTSSFSTCHAMRSSGAHSGGATPSPSPSYLALSLRRIVPNPRTRAALAVGVVLLAAVDTYAYVTYWPKIAGKGRGGGVPEVGGEGDSRE